MSTTTTTTVHWTQPGLMALSETDGHGDTCGPLVILDYLHLHDPAHHPLTIAHLDAMRADLISWGLMNTKAYRGMTISSIAAAFEQHYGVKPVKVAPYSASLDFQTFRADLIRALLAHQLVIMETANAAALPDNQRGVQYHFVLFGGIDSASGYYTCNGDTYTALRHPGGTVSPVWYGVKSLAAAKPVGYIILPSLDPVTPPPPTQPPASDPVKDAALAAVQALKAALGEL